MSIAASSFLPGRDPQRRKFRLAGKPRHRDLLTARVTDLQRFVFAAEQPGELARGRDAGRKQRGIEVDGGVSEPVGGADTCQQDPNVGRSSELAGGLPERCRW
ncbi:MAG: hypothetical protein Ct9H300mP1_31490 [Planctomycetaceae bacterium]|nr:MAG: hypothetical protein Ct9H300mP1_31490 [Planctomycetaceae bacterium]